MKNDKTEPIPVMDYRQYRRARRLVHECCNYIDGNCIALDDGEECVCVQSISYSLVCGISSHTINPFLLAIIVYAFCTKKTILCTNI